MTRLRGTACGPPLRWAGILAPPVLAMCLLASVALAQEPSATPDPDEQRYREVDLSGLDAFVEVIAEGDMLLLTITTLVPAADVGAPRRSGSLSLYRAGTLVREGHTVRWLDVAVDGWYLPTAAVSPDYQARLTDLGDHTVTPQDVTYRAATDLAAHIVTLGRTAEGLSPTWQPGDLVQAGRITLQYAQMLAAIDPAILEIPAVRDVLGVAVIDLEPLRLAGGPSAYPTPVGTGIAAELTAGTAAGVGLTIGTLGWVVWLGLVAVMAWIGHQVGVSLVSIAPYVGWALLAGAASELLPWGVVLAVSTIPILVGSALVVRRVTP